MSYGYVSSEITDRGLNSADENGTLLTFVLLLDLIECTGRQVFRALYFFGKRCFRIRHALPSVCGTKPWSVDLLISHSCVPQRRDLSGQVLKVNSQVQLIQCNISIQLVCSIQLGLSCV